MNYQNLVRDFATRTRANLKAIDQLHANGAQVYETTQLINSMLGLLVFPREEFLSHVPETPFAQLVQEGWPAPTVSDGFPEVENLRQLIRYLRNAVAHFNITFLSGPGGEIVGLRVWNTPPRSRTKTWEAELGIADLRHIAERFTDLILEEADKVPIGRPERAL